MSTAYGRPACTLARRSLLQRVDAKPLSAFIATSAKEARRRQGTPLAEFFNIPIMDPAEFWRSHLAPDSWPLAQEASLV